MKLINAAAGFAVMLIVLTSLATPPRADPIFDAVAGEYVVIAVRQNSFVAAPADSIPGGTDSPIGKRIAFETNGVVLQGIGCDDWQAETMTPAVDFLDDANLSDLRLPPTDSPVSDGDKRLSKFFKITCEGEPFTDIYQADNRVLALSWANSQKYLILERQLSAAQVKKLQKSLKSMKFYSGDVNGQFDEATENSVREWYSYRLADPKVAIPRRPAITENLLDTLKVLD